MWRCGVVSSRTDNWRNISKAFRSVKKEKYGKAAEEVRPLTIHYNTDWAPHWQRLISSGRTSWYFPSWWSTVGDELREDFTSKKMFSFGHRLYYLSAPCRKVIIDWTLTRWFLYLERNFLFSYKKFGQTIRITSDFVKYITDQCCDGSKHLSTYQKLRVMSGRGLF